MTLPGVFSAAAIVLSLGYAETPKCGTEFELTLPERPAPGQTRVLQIDLDSPEKVYVEITSETGAFVAAVVPFGPLGRTRYSIDLVKLPADAIRLRLNAAYLQRRPSATTPYVCVYDVLYE